MKKLLFSTTFLPLALLANPSTQLSIDTKKEVITDKLLKEPVSPLTDQIVAEEAGEIEPITPIETLSIEKQLDTAIQQRRYDIVEKLLPIYKQQFQQDPILVLWAEAVLAKVYHLHATAIDKLRQIIAINPALNTVRIELAITLFEAKYDLAAKEQFMKASAEANVPPSVQQLITHYLTAITQRSGWQSSLSITYLHDKNVNRVSSSREIENSGFIKADEMLPQSAEGFAYSASLSRDFNVINSHYFSLENTLWGQFYWDNKAFNDSANRFYLGYNYQSALQNWKILPFYQYRWVGNTHYQTNYGIYAKFSHWLSTQLQFTTEVEYSKQRYVDYPKLNGDNQYASMTVLWRQNARQYFYLNSHFNREKTHIRQYDSDTLGLKFGWSKEWQKGISSRLVLAFSQRHYKDKLVLGNVLPLNKVRKDKLYRTNLILWKRDWHLWQITPKLQLSWNKQASNIPSLYSYSERNINILLEKTF